MVLGIGVILLLGFVLGRFSGILKLPTLVGMIVAGMLIGEFGLNLLGGISHDISGDLRRVALVIILSRAGLNLDLSDLKKVGRPAVLICFLPACFEILGIILFGTLILKISILESAVLGTVLAAVSPAVIVPRMLKLIEEKRGTANSIPQLILAGASVDDVFVIVLFTAFSGVLAGGKIQGIMLLSIPISIVIGIIFGGILGFIMGKLYNKFKLSPNEKTIIFFSIALVISAFEGYINPYVPYSGLIAVMSMGIILRQSGENHAEIVSAKMTSLWSGAEILLFVLVGATVNLKFAFTAGLGMIIVILSALIFRIAGVFCCLIKTKLDAKERLFCAIAYTPKATVQAAIGGVPLAMGLACGDLVLTGAVLAILITAPIGAFAIDRTYKKLLSSDLK